MDRPFHYRMTSSVVIPAAPSGRRVLPRAGSVLPHRLFVAFLIGVGLAPIAFGVSTQRHRPTELVVYKLLQKKVPECTKGAMPKGAGQPPPLQACAVGSYDGNLNLRCELSFSPKMVQSAHCASTAQPRSTCIGHSSLTSAPKLANKGSN